VKPSGRGAAVLPSSGASLEEAAATASRGSRVHLPRYSEGASEEASEKASEKALTRSIYYRHLRGSWSLARDPLDPAKMLLLEGRVALEGGEDAPAMGDVRIGVLLSNGRGLPVAGDLVKVPLLLPGGSQEFQFRLPAADAESIQVGITAP
jgi:hypothetical protein